MKVSDFAKAAGVALLLMVLNVAAAFAAVFVYSVIVAPGHDEAFYQAAAQRIAPWSSIFAGMPLFFAAGWLFAKRRPARNRYAFAASFSGFYAVADVSILASEGALLALGGFVAASMITKFAAALVGARIA
ncbi:hypothetical protein [Terricaulis sp.]|uniref:hypothetical protein n=1 Tax=Terricaulis sp. TaxID=2768686 RepID=UPI003784613C